MIKEALVDPEAPAPGDVYGAFALPNWVGDRSDKAGGLVDTSENEAYIARKQQEKEKKQRLARDGTSLAALANHVATQEGIPKQPRFPGDDGGGDDGPGDGGGDPSTFEAEGAGHEGGIKSMLQRARDPDGEDAFFQPQRYQ